MFRGLKKYQKRYEEKLALLSKQTLVSCGHTIFITSIPKSGSSFLVKGLCNYTKFSLFFLSYNTLNSHDLYLPKLLDSWNLDTVAHQHTMPTVANLDLIGKFRIRPIVLTRNLFDVAVSLTDHLESESLETPIFYSPKIFHDMTRSERLDMVIDLAMPWCVQFFANWTLVSKIANYDIMWLKYEEFITDKVKFISRVLEWHNLPFSVENLSATLGEIDKSETRFNKGIVGRGLQELTDFQQERIMILCRHYKEIDFAAVGLQ